MQKLRILPVGLVAFGFVLGSLSAIVVPRELPWLWARVALSVINTVVWCGGCIQMLLWIRKDRQEHKAVKQEIDETIETIHKLLDGHARSTTSKQEPLN